MKTISEELRQQVREYCDKNNPEVYWDYNDTLGVSQMKTILEKSLDVFEDELFDLNMEYMSELEDYFLESELIPRFKDALIAEGFESDGDIHDILQDFVYCSLNTKKLLKTAGEVICCIPFYSNYDCTNSFDTLKSSDYLRQVLNRVKKGVNKEDFMWEHSNGAYGGSLFMFIFRTDFLNLLNLKEQIKTGKYINIPKGTQFGFFSSFQGCGSPFEKVTSQDMKIKVRENTKGYHPEYDHVDIIADIEQSCRIDDVYGCSVRFADQQNITII
jgi:hypothetical protein